MGDLVWHSSNPPHAFLAPSGERYVADSSRRHVNSSRRGVPKVEPPGGEYSAGATALRGLTKNAKSEWMTA